METDTIHLAATVPVTEAEGPGKRFAIWVQGCPFRCPGCCNPQYLEFGSDQPVSVDSLLEQIRERKDEVEGITLIGGEPFAQVEALAALAGRVREEFGHSVMIFTGYTMAELREDERAGALLGQTDLLVDGLYVAGQPDTQRRWIGSTNQQIHFLTDRYADLRPEAEGWPAAGNTVEIRLVDGKLSINGFPVREITRMSKDLGRRED